MSSIGALSIASSRSAQSAKSGRSARSVASSTTSQKLRKESRSILQALNEETPLAVQAVHSAAAQPAEEDASQQQQAESASSTPSELDSEEWNRDAEQWRKTSGPLDLTSLPLSPQSSPESKKGRSPPPTIAHRRTLTAAESHSRHTSLSSSATGSSTIFCSAQLRTAQASMQLVRTRIESRRQR